MRYRVGGKCETPGCQEEFYARWETGIGVLSKPIHLCRKCYSREWMRKKRHEGTCNKKGCREKATCHHRGLDKHHCLEHHNEMFHVESSPLFRADRRKCCCYLSIRLRGIDD